MKSKADIVRQNLSGLKVLDIGGCGYGEDNAYERELNSAWTVARSRTIVDVKHDADISINFNQLPLPPIANQWDITTAFDVLEHLEHPTAVLRWIPTNQLIVCLPNALSPLLRTMEERNKQGHLYSFTPYTAKTLITNSAVWKIENSYFTFGRWSWIARAINFAGSALPSRFGTGIVFHCRRVIK